MAELSDSTALVTGGGRGLGREIAIALAAAGASVGLVARSAGELAETVQLITGAGGRAVAAPADVTDRQATAAALATLQEALGAVDLLVNNAGVTGPIAPFVDNDPDAWWRTIEVNLGSAMLCTHLVLPEMIAMGRGRIVNITSRAGVFRWPMASAYAVSKAAVVKLTENLAAEVRRHGITVLSYDPGLLPIGFTAAMTTAPPPAGTPEARVMDWLLREREQGRGAEPEQAVRQLLALVSGRADALTGRHVTVHDDLDALLRDIDAVVAGDLQLLRLRSAEGRWSLSAEGR